jgi:hypothetical protein
MPPTRLFRRDRMPFLTDIATGQPTYTAALTETSHSMIIANYGASQSFDNDDGSSYYDTHDNFFYDASGQVSIHKRDSFRHDLTTLVSSSLSSHSPL